MAASKALDVVLFGATGFTGGLTAEYLARASAERPFRWGIAGRSRDKLENVKARLVAIEPRAKDIELIVADVDDEPSLHAMAARAKAVATTVGPYAKYGEAVVAACVAERAHYADLTGEPAFMSAMIDRYHASAAAARVKIVHACGFDSIPHDLGAYFTLKALRAEPSFDPSAPVRMEGVVRMNGDVSGGTWHSAIHAMSGFAKGLYEQLQREKNATVVGDDRRVGALPPSIHRREDLGLWALPMPTIDPQIVRRSARLLPEYGADFRYGHYLGVRRLPAVAAVLAGAGTVFTLAHLAPTRKLLLSLKDPGEGPNEEQRAKNWFRVIFRAEAGSTTVTCEVRGKDPGYGETAKMLSESVLCLALDEART
ncbi:MAG: saccharopine dehydrogenase NADP-binding domain-containing protein, partial [Polyangiaceae bacterium]|nr:saccharopine dehydrogenase NADP-binding domain-containing protein [Polyangiaceae bacterium]